MTTATAPSPTQTIVLAQGVALAVLLGVDGPPPWLAVRAVVVLGITVAVLWASARTGVRRSAWALLAFGVGGSIVGGAIGAAILIFVVTPLTLAIAVTNVAPLHRGSATPRDLGMTYEEVSLHTDNGLRLAAWYVPSTNGAAVVLLAGATNTRDSEIDHAAVLARHGYGVLLLDVRGHAESEGDAMLWGWSGDSDVRAAVDYLATRSDVRSGRIGAMGMSMGAEQVIGAAGDDARIRAVVGEGSTARDVRDEGTPIHGVGGWLIRYFDWTTAQAADLMTSAHRPTKLRDAIAAAAPRPLMIISAGTQPAEIDAAHFFQAAAPDSVELWIAPDAGHTTAYDTYPDEWETRVIDFLDRTLR